jgi:AraC family transcriptional regulator, transcriptional activator of the genes for pyochelin and ferripyochelin receptors
MIKLDSTDLNSVSDEVQQNGTETLLRLPQRFGMGSDRIIELRYGLHLVLREAELCQSIQVKNPHAQEIPLVSKFHLSGNSRVLTPGVPEISDDYEEISGCNYLYYLPDLVEFEEWRSQELIQVIMVLVDVEYLRSFGMGYEVLPEPLQQLVGGTAKRFHQPLGQTTTAMQQVLQQILRCPYRGIMQQMYLEGKALELLTLQLTSWAAYSTTSQPNALKARDIERLHYAREVLVRDLENPPSLVELAQQVGISDRKLKQGFRRLFGKTVFGYLHDYRLEKAHQLLETDRMTVAEVSYEIGFANRGYFAAAFRRKFGVNPGDFQMNCRRNRIFSA